MDAVKRRKLCTVVPIIFFAVRIAAIMTMLVPKLSGRLARVK